MRPGHHTEAMGLRCQQSPRSQDFGLSPALASGGNSCPWIWLWVRDVPNRQRPPRWKTEMGWCKLPGGVTWSPGQPPRPLLHPFPPPPAPQSHAPAHLPETYVHLRASPRPLHPHPIPPPAPCAHLPCLPELRAADCAQSGGVQFRTRGNRRLPWGSWVFVTPRGAREWGRGGRNPGLRGESPSLGSETCLLRTDRAGALWGPRTPDERNRWPLRGLPARRRRNCPRLCSPLWARPGSRRALWEPGPQRAPQRRG